MHGLNKVSFSLNGELTTVATNDYCIHDYLCPHLSSRERDTPFAASGILKAWKQSCHQAEVLWAKLITSAPGLKEPTKRRVEDACLSRGQIPGKPLSSYRILPCTAAMADDSWNCPYMPRQGGNYLHTRKGGMVCFVTMAQPPSLFPSLRFVLKKKLRKLWIMSGKGWLTRNASISVALSLVMT